MKVLRNAARMNCFAFESCKLAAKTEDAEAGLGDRFVAVNHAPAAQGRRELLVCPS